MKKYDSLWFSKDSKIYCGVLGGNIDIFNLETQNILFNYKLSNIIGVKFSNDNSLFILKNSNGVIHVYDLKTNTHIKSFETTKSLGLEFTLSSDNTHIISCDNNGNVVDVDLVEGSSDLVHCFKGYLIDSLSLDKINNTYYFSMVKKGQDVWKVVEWKYPFKSNDKKEIFAIQNEDITNFRFNLKEKSIIYTIRLRTNSNNLLVNINSKSQIKSIIDDNDFPKKYRNKYRFIEYWFSNGEIIILNIDNDLIFFNLITKSIIDVIENLSPLHIESNHNENLLLIYTTVRYCIYNIIEEKNIIDIMY